MTPLDRLLASFLPARLRPAALALLYVVLIMGCIILLPLGMNAHHVYLDAG